MPQIVIEILDDQDITSHTSNLNPHEGLKRLVEKFRQDVKHIIANNPKIIKVREVMQ